ncbi:hypothetical protein AU210_008436 [Fusarium oxysporum f. sp. radicis-cucumerinum]|uniref:Uncharacterized protein n=1 Tax=Fusarium oxysporum f. sp. radicis-cucumerinum TaxID=327505 RepID=A0A2H3H7B3_FUSOX|nr:hypothetical protein AU210_008436 [Fusarium oxysporum f. sp. radicis-cucumerinum]
MAATKHLLADSEDAIVDRPSKKTKVTDVDEKARLKKERKEKKKDKKRKTEEQETPADKTGDSEAERR